MPILCAHGLKKEKINVIHCVPTLLRSLLNAAEKKTFQSVTHLFVSGEVLTPGDVGRWFQCCNGHQARLVNLYGPSETTMTKFAYFVKPGDQELGAIPIGKPIRGAEAILLNQHGKPSPVGAIGEIYIRTAYRSLGYYGKPDLNKEAFIANPFRNDPTDLLYKTGDIGRILEDGNYEFLGRSDSQIKLRGIRIELSEIEVSDSHLPTNPGLYCRSAGSALWRKEPLCLLRFQRSSQFSQPAGLPGPEVARVHEAGCLRGTCKVAAVV